jgi:hypothetical protein
MTPSFFRPHFPMSAVRFLYIIASMLATLGCGSRDTIREQLVEGRVIYAGQPIADGELRFESLGSAPGSRTAIKEGQYRLTLQSGNAYRVRIMGFRPKRGGKPNQSENVPGLAVGAVPTEQFLPQKYNDQSALQIAVGEQDSPFVKDFELTK